MGLFSGNTIAIDLGSSFTAIYLSGQGIALREPTSILTLREDAQSVVAVGEEAYRMLGRTAEETVLMSPVIDGAVTDVDAATLLMLALAEKAAGRRKPMEKGQLFVGMSQGLTRVEHGALEQAARQTGAKRPILVRAPLAAALGAGLDADQPRGRMVVVLGGGTTEIAVISMNAVVAARSMRTGCFSMDEAIVRYVRRKKGLIIGPRTAEDLKCDIGSATLPDYDAEDEDLPDAPDEAGEEAAAEAGPQGEKVLLKGRDAKTGKPRTVPITTRDVALALKEPVRLLIDAMHDALSRTPPELAGDVKEEGVHLSGGGALLEGLAPLLSEKLEVPVTVSEHPQDDVLLGIARLSDDDKLRNLAVEAGTVEE